MEQVTCALSRCKVCLIKMYSVAIFISVFVYSSLSIDLPSYLPKCYLDDPEVNKCFLRAFNQIRPFVSNGIEEIGLPPLNPFVISKMTIVQDTPMANYTAAFINYTIGGLDNYVIKEFQYDPKTMTFNFRIEFDALPMSALYEMSGHVVHIPLEGKGIGRASLGPINAVFQIKGNMRRSRGIDYYNTKNANVQLNIADGSYHLEGLFDNNRELESMANSMLNSNSIMVTEAITPMLEKLSEMGMMRFMKTLTRIPYFKLFPLSH